MPLIRDEGVVLTRVDYSETSQVIAVFTRTHGKVRAIAKGIKRGTKARFAVGIDLLDIGTIVAATRAERDAALATVTEWKQTRSLPGLREKLSRIQAAQYAAEITSHLTEDWDPHDDLYDSFVALLIQLADAAEPLPDVVRYQLALLDAVGSMPRFEVCALCRRGEDLTYFSSFEGGMICRHCEAVQVEKREVTAKTWRALREGRFEPSNDAHDGPRAETDDPVSPERVARASAIGPFSLLNYHIAHLMGREPLLASKLVPPEERRILK